MLVVNQGVGGQAVGGQGGTRVEPEPAPSTKGRRPKTVKGMLWGSMGTPQKSLAGSDDHGEGQGGISGRYVHHGAAGEIQCPHGLPSSPRRPTTQWQSGSYTMVAQTKLKIKKALNLTRSTKAPVISAGVMMANII